MQFLLLMPPQLIGPFIFRDLGYLYQLVVPGQVPCVGFIWPCRSFRLLPSCYEGWPSASLVRWLPCIWITVLLRLTCVIKMYSVSFAFQAGLPDTESDGITLIPAYIPTHLNVEADYLSWDQLLLEWHFLPQVPQAAFCLWGLPEVDLLACTLGLNAFSHHWTFQVSYMFTPLALVPLVLSRVSGRTCQQSTQTFDYGGTMLDGGSLASHSSQHVGRCSSVSSHHKISHCGCFGWPGAQGSVISAFNPLAAQ